METRIDAGDDWNDEIARLERDGVAAFLARDLETLGRLFAEELIVNSPLNRVTDKKTVLDLLGRGIIGHTSYVEKIEAVRRLGDLVTVMGADVVTNPPDEKPMHRRFTNVWRARNGGWELIIRHATVVGASAP
ncbi:MAG TPA: nuclear transport factor 2 family protein [Thermoanaerobaculia bacterium]|nr:nuclear transport factor 2 family protein [Thermoanaerobaculia bacterium]